MDINQIKPMTDEEMGIGIPADPDLEKLEEQEKIEKASKEQPKEEEVDEESDEEEQESSKDDEEDDSDDEEEEEESPKKSKANNKGVPFKRFQEVLKKSHAQEAQMEAALRRVAELEAMQAEKQAAKEAEEDAYDFSLKEREYAKLVNEVDYEKAAELRAEINAKLAQAVAKHSRKDLEQEIAYLKQEQHMVRVKAELDLVAKEIWTDHPFLDHNSKSANAEAIKEMVDLRDFYMKSKGLSAGMALKQAAKVVIPMFSDVAPRKEGGKSKREAEANARAQEASERMPPSTGKVGVGAKAERVSEKEVSQKQWFQMNESERNEVLGIKNVR